MPDRVVVVGAVGLVGRELLRSLAERGFPAREVVALGSGRAVRGQVGFGERTLAVQSLERFGFEGAGLALFGAEASVSAAHAPRAAAAGWMVVDTSRQFRMEHDVPLVVPEVNPQALGRHARRRIVACPSSSAIQLSVVLQPLHARFGLRQVVATVLKPVAEAGKAGMDELFGATKASFVGDVSRPEQFTKAIAFNLIPQTDRFLDDGSTRDEWLLGAELRKVLDPELRVMATGVRVPVFLGESVSVTATFEQAPNLGEVRDLLRGADGVNLLDTREDGGFVTPAECGGEDAVYVSRLRAQAGDPHTLGLWCVTDSLRKGAALNAVQVAEAMLSGGLLA